MSPKDGRQVPPAIKRVERQTAEHVMTWRKLRGLTQAQLAERAGVARSTLRRIETADLAVSVENLLRILRGLGLLDAVPRALDPMGSDIGRLRSEERLPRRVRPKRLDLGDAGDGDG